MTTLFASPAAVRSAASVMPACTVIVRSAGSNSTTSLVIR